MSDKAQPFTEVSAYVNSDELEQGILAFWEQADIFKKSLTQTEDKEPFTFYDGPPYATGKPHYGHVLQSALKDTVLRYKTMQGYHVPRRVGWDTHGLPVEVLVEKELGLATKQDVEEYGIEEFNAKCREAVFRYIDLFEATLKRLGRWAQYDQSYATLDRDYMESEWWVFKQLWEKDLIYQDFRSTPYCIRCATPLSNFETGMGYKDRTDAAVYVKLKVVDGTDEPTYLVVWTTTPWTLPANVAAAFNPELRYVTVSHEGAQYVVAKERVETLFGENTKIVHEWTAAELTQVTYEPLWPEVGDAGAWKLVPAEFVTAEDGTGLVHEAPAFGVEDAELAKQHGLPVIRNIDATGHYVAEVQPSWLAGMLLWEANERIVTALQERGALFKREQYRHSYPHCWRCDEPLIYYALDSWFVRVSQLKDDLLRHNEAISWIPEHIQHGRFAKGLESAPDWAVSRNRFWSTPIPVWQCDACSHSVCIGGVDELKERSGTEVIDDLHRPYVDELIWQCETCTGGTMRRVPEVLDVWFDSGSMPYAQWHYPFENEEFVEQNFPADFIVESIEMTRAWFYVLHVLAVALKDAPAYRQVIGSGIIFGEDGNKLSKKLKNYPDIEPTVAQYGADTVRFFFLNSTLGEPYVFAEKELKRLHRQFYQTLWNVYSFFVRYANTQDWVPPEDPFVYPESDNLLDEWIMARTKQLEQQVVESMEAYRVDQATRAFVPFVDDLSNWYVRRSRSRFHPSQAATDSEAAFATLYVVLVRLARLLAPFMPFVAEELYRNLTKQESVHLEQLGDSEPLTVEETTVVETMGHVRAIVSEGLSVRAKAKLKVRQPLAELRVVGAQVSDELVAIIRDEVNVKQVTFGAALPLKEGWMVSGEDARVAVALDTELTDELRAEGIAREVIRHGQLLRREAGYALDDRIILLLTSESSEIAEALEAQRKTIAEALQAEEVVSELAASDIQKEVKVADAVVTVGVKRG